MNQFNIGFPTYWRDYQRLGHEVATEHTMYSTTQKLWDIGAKRGWTNVDDTGNAWDKNFTPWKFKDGATRRYHHRYKVPFWDGQGDYNVEWNFDTSCDCYKRMNAGWLISILIIKPSCNPKMWSFNSKPRITLTMVMKIISIYSMVRPALAKP